MLNKIQIVFSFFLLLLVTVKCQENAIAVVEYQVFYDKLLTPNDVLIRNTDRYVEIIQEASADNKLMAIIFPEGTLDNIQEMKDKKSYSTKIGPDQNPCFVHSHRYPAFMRRLSCAARDAKTAIIFNVIENESDEFYSSDVVMNELGDIVLSVRRETRIGVNFLNHPPITFEIPVRHHFKLKNKQGESIPFVVTSFITGFSFSYEKVIDQEYQRTYLVCSNWVSQLPFLTSLQVYQMWAQEFNVTIFFSGANNPKKSQGGTGIYHVGQIMMDILPSGGTQSYIYRFSKIEDPGNVTNPPDESETAVSQMSNEMDKMFFEVDPDIERFAFRLIDPRRSQLKTQLCYDKTPGNFFCCEFNLQMSFNQDAAATGTYKYVYHIVAYKGYKTYYNIFEPGGVEICAVIACLDRNISSCGKRFGSFIDVAWPTTFESIEIGAKFGAVHKDKIYVSSQFPNSLLSSMKPIDAKHTEWKEEHIKEFHDYGVDDKVKRIFTLTKPQNHILTFGIFGRNFSIIDPRKSADRAYFVDPLLIGIVFYMLMI